MVRRIASTSRRVASLSAIDWQYVAIAVKELLIARIRHAIQPVGGILRELQDKRLRFDDNTEGEVDWRAYPGRLEWRQRGFPGARTVCRKRWPPIGGCAATESSQNSLSEWQKKRAGRSKAMRLAALRRDDSDRRQWRGLHHHNRANLARDAGIMWTELFTVYGS